MRALLSTLAAVAALAGCRVTLFPPGNVPAHRPRHLDHLSAAERREYLRRAQVWRATDVASLDLARGPDGKDAFALNEEVRCEYAERPFGGATPKFGCLVGGELLKVKYGRKNNEVYANPAAGRLLWALGFGADRFYPVRVICEHCPVEPWFYRTPQRTKERRYDYALIERRLAGEDIEVPGFEGWSWPELDQVDESAGGATRAQRDALKLMAVLLQHSDNKPEQQRMVCLPDGFVRDAAGNEDCTQPFLYIADLGVTFGKATLFNTDAVDLRAWAATPVWRDPGRCVGALKRSITGTLGDPPISEAGRRFLADLLALLTDRQLANLFRASRFQQRTPSGVASDSAIVEWVRVFKEKRDAIVNHRCPG